MGWLYRSNLLAVETISTLIYHDIRIPSHYPYRFPIFRSIQILLELRKKDIEVDFPAKKKG